MNSFRTHKNQKPKHLPHFRHLCHGTLHFIKQLIELILDALGYNVLEISDLSLPSSGTIGGDLFDGSVDIFLFVK